MRATYRLIGCALCIAGIGGAAATNLDTHDLDGSPQAMIDSVGSHGGGSSSDTTGLGRDCPPADNSGRSTGTSGSSQDRSSGGASSTSSPPHRPHLGWQSLLPGSIQ